jgi:DNA polymerase-1
MSKELVTLKQDVFDTIDFEEYRMDVEHPFLNIYDELVKYEQNGVLRMLHAKNMVSESQKENAVVNAEAQRVDQGEEDYGVKLEFKATLIRDAQALNKALSSLAKDTVVAFDTETTGLDYDKDKLVGFSFCIDEKEAFYVPFAHFYLGVPDQISEEEAKAAIRKIFESKVVGHNVKFDLHFVTRFLQDDTLEIYADSMILAWLINPESALSLDKLSEKLLGHTMVAFKDTVKKGETFAGVELEDACLYAAEDAFITAKLYNLFLEKLELQSAGHLIVEARDVEFPFITTLLNMEKEGIEIDAEFLELFLVEVKETLSTLTQSIHTLAGGEFNINSTKQLGVILFETLGLPVGKKRRQVTLQMKKF